MGFMRAKELDVRQGRGKGGRGRGRQQKERMFQINQEALEKMKGMPEWERLVRPLLILCVCRRIQSKMHTVLGDKQSCERT